MLRIRNNLIGEFSIANVIYNEALGDFDFYGHDGNIVFSLELNDAEFEAVAGFLGEEVFDDAPTGVFSHEAVANDKPTGVFSLEAAA